MSKNHFPHVAGALAALLALAGPAHEAHAAAPITVGVTAGIPGFPVAHRGITYFTASFKLFYQGGAVWLSGSEAGITTGTSVDDILSITVTHPDGTQSSTSFDYSGNCLNAIEELPPTDLSNLFQKGENKVKVVLKDLCGNVAGAHPIWLSTQVP
ncbi:MAG: hypothetical protein U1F53_08925 [Burkholderiaceae bacterium]